MLGRAIGTAAYSAASRARRTQVIRAESAPKLQNRPPRRGHFRARVFPVPTPRASRVWKLLSEGHMVVKKPQPPMRVPRLDARPKPSAERARRIEVDLEFGLGGHRSASVVGTKSIIHAVPRPNFHQQNVISKGESQLRGLLSSARLLARPPRRVGRAGNQGMRRWWRIARRDLRWGRVRDSNALVQLQVLLTATRAISFASIFIPQAGKFVATANAVAITGRRSSLDWNQSHAVLRRGY